MSNFLKVKDEDIKNSIEKGLTWLVAQQNTTAGATFGSWGTQNLVATTGLAVLKLESYALEQGLSPFDPKYKYNKQVIDGLNYILANAKTSTDGIYFQDGSYINYTTGIILAAISASSDPTRVVTVAPLAPKTYKEVAQGIANYLAWSQDDKGGWAYEKGDTPDNSVSGYVVLGLAFGLSKLYKFEVTLPATLFTKLDSWITYIQNANGGSGYTNPNEWVNSLKTGNLLQQMYVYGDVVTKERVQKAITYIANNWTDMTGVGWNGNPAYYQATFTIMKGLESYGVEKIKPTTGAEINWFDDMAAVIIAQQITTPGSTLGSWPQTEWDTDSKHILSTVWPLLTLEKVSAAEKVKLTLTKTSSKDAAKICDVITYTISVKNEGTIALNNILLKDELVKELCFIKGSLRVDEEYSCSQDLKGGVFLGTLLPGEEKIVTFRAKVLCRPNTDIIVNKATAEFSYVEDSTIKTGNAESNINNVNFVVVQVNTIIESNVTCARLNSEIMYRIRVKNNSNVPLQNVLLVNDLPDELQLIGKVNIDGKDVDNVNLKYLPLGAMTIGQEITIIYKALVVKSPFKCAIHNTAIAYFSYEVKEILYSGESNKSCTVVKVICC